MEAYLIVSLFAFFFLGIIWNRSDGFNLFIKMFLLGMCAWGVFIAWNDHYRMKVRAEIRQEIQSTNTINTLDIATNP